MKISRYKLAEILSQRSLKPINEKQFSKEIAAYLLTENRTNEIDSLLRDMKLLRLKDGIIEVDVFSSFPLNQTLIQKIKTKAQELYPQAKDVIINENIDPNIVGGIRLEFANAQLDLSVRAKLNQLKQLTVNSGGKI